MSITRMAPLANTIAFGGVAKMKGQINFYRMTKVERLKRSKKLLITK